MVQAWFAGAILGPPTWGGTMMARRGFAVMSVGATSQMTKGVSRGMDSESLIFPILVSILVALMAILFGPSLYSSLQNWRIKRGGRK